MELNSQISTPIKKGLYSSGHFWKNKGEEGRVYWKNRNILIAGYGVVGSAFDKILTDAKYPHDVCDPYVLKDKKLNTRYHTIHICFPCYYEDKFIENVMGYIYTFNPEYVIIHSTIGMYTLEKMHNFTLQDVKLFHAPIRGVEIRGANGIKEFKTYVGGINPNIDLALNWYLDMLGLNWKWVRSHKESALGKIVGTTWYGMVIAFAIFIQKICDEHGINFDQAYTEYMRTDIIGRDYSFQRGEHTARPRFNEYIPRPINIPGEIGGHCVMENLEFLMDAFDDNKFVMWIREMNRYMKNKPKEDIEYDAEEEI